MKVDVHNISSYQRKLDIVVPAAQVRKELDSAYQTWGRRVKLHGFRPGKVPRKVLESRFGPAVKQDVMEKLVQASWTEVLSGKTVDPVGRPSVDQAGEISGNADFAFSIVVDVKPEITLQTYTGVKVPYPKVEVADVEVELATRARLEANSRLVEVTKRGVESGDMVMVELVASDGDDVVAREIGTMIRTEADPYYPGLEEHLVGMKTGKEKKARVTFGEHARTEEVAGRELDVTVKVVSIQANEVPKLSDEIAEELGFEGGAKGMTAAIRAQLAEGREELARNQARANMLEKLIEANPFDVPEGMVDNALNMLLEELRMQQAFRTGVDPKQVRFSEAQLADLRTRAVFASKASLILEFVGKAENITVTDDDITAKYQELADARGQTIEAIKGWFAKDESVQELKDRILEEKTLEWLLERSEIVPEEAAAAAPAEEKPAKKAKGGKKKADKGEEAAAEPAPEAAPAVDTSVLGKSVVVIKDELESGMHDAHLDALEAAENAGKARKGVLAAIAARRG